jgi:hypothetical protein
MSVFRELFDDLHAAYVSGRTATVRALVARLEQELSRHYPEVGQWPICVKCGGYGELPRPGDEASGARSACRDVPGFCVGNLYGRMTPEQFLAYVGREARPEDAHAVILDPPAAEPKPEPPNV